MNNNLHNSAVSSGVVTNAISVDVEDYFHTEAITRSITRDNWPQMPPRVENSTQRLFELFSRHGVRGTFFFLGWVAERYPNLVREAIQLGHEIGCHSYWHRPVCSLRPGEFREDLLRGKKVIEDAGGRAVRGYRAPSFSMTAGTEWAVEILEQEGFAYDSSVHPIMHDMFDNRNAPRWPHRWGSRRFVEIPVTTTRLGSRNLPFCGGAYFRVFPYAYTKWAMRRLNERERRPAVFYLHPWEIDPDQPRVQASRRTTFRQYTGLKNTKKKLHRLLSDFPFAPLCEVFRSELGVLENPKSPAFLHRYQPEWNHYAK